MIKWTFYGARLWKFIFAFLVQGGSDACSSSLSEGSSGVVRPQTRDIHHTALLVAFWLEV
jgi:hypothetical protein